RRAGSSSWRHRCRRPSHRRCRVLGSSWWLTPVFRLVQGVSRKPSQTHPTVVVARVLHSSWHCRDGRGLIGDWVFKSCCCGDPTPVSVEPGTRWGTPGALVGPVAGGDQLLTG